MAIRKLYLGNNGIEGSYLDLGLTSMGLSLQDTTFKVTASSGADTIYLRPSGYTFEFSDGAAADKVYVTGDYADYTVATITDSGVEWLELTRGSGATAETIRLASDSTTTLVFADGYNTVATVANAVENSLAVALDDSENSKEPQNIQATASASTIRDTAGSNDSQTFTSGGNQAAVTAIGNGKVDYVYVGQGGDVDATLLGAGEDVIYLEGNWADYQKSVSGLQITLTRTVTDVYSGEETTESVTVSAGRGSAEDKLVFRDGTITTTDARTRLQAAADGEVVTVAQLGLDWSSDETSQSSASSAATGLSLSTDTGSSNADSISNDGTVTVNGLVEGFRWQYSTDSGTNWNNGVDSGTFMLTNTEGDQDGTAYAIGQVQVRQINPYGVVSETVSNAVAITVDDQSSEVSNFAMTINGQSVAYSGAYQDLQSDEFQYHVELGGDGRSIGGARAMLSSWFYIDSEQPDGTFTLLQSVSSDASGDLHHNDVNVRVETVGGVKTAKVYSHNPNEFWEVPIDEWFEAGIAQDAYTFSSNSYFYASTTESVNSPQPFLESHPQSVKAKILAYNLLSGGTAHIHASNISYLDHPDRNTFIESTSSLRSVTDEFDSGDGLVAHWDMADTNSFVVSDTARQNDFGTESLNFEALATLQFVSVDQIFTGTATPYATVSYTWNDGTDDHVFTAVADENGSYSVTVSFVDSDENSTSGVEYLGVVQTDVAGNSSEPQTFIVFVGVSLISAPTLVAADDTGLSGDLVTSDVLPVIEVKLPTGFDSANETVDLYRVAVGGSVETGTKLITSESNGVLRHEPVSAWSGSAAGTTYDVVAVYTQADNTTTQSRTSITIDTAAETPEISSASVPTEILTSVFDAEGDYILRGTAEKGSQSVTVTVSDGNAATDNPSFTAVVLTDGSWTATIKQTELAVLDDGEVSITAVVTDAAGNTAQSAATTTTLELTNEAVQSNSEVTIPTLTISEGTVAANLTILDLNDVNGDGDNSDRAFTDDDSPSSSFATLTYSATLSDGSALPTYLTVTEAGKVQVLKDQTVPDLSVNNVTITVTATDGAGTTATRDITFDTDNSRFALTSALNETNNVDVRSTLSLSLGDSDATAVTGGTITIVNLANTTEKAGYNGESAAHDNIVIDVTDTNAVSIESDGTVIVTIPGDLDLANSYAVLVSAGAFENTTTSATSAEVTSGQIVFGTVSPSVTGSSSVTVDGTGNVVESALWYDAVAGDGDSFAQSLSSKETVTVIGRDTDTSSATSIDSDNQSTYALTGFGSDDEIYIDRNYGDAANSYDSVAVQITHDGTAPTTLQFAGDGGSVLVNVTFDGADSDKVAEDFTTAAAGAASFESITGNADPVISG